MKKKIDSEQKGMRTNDEASHHVAIREEACAGQAINGKSSKWYMDSACTSHMTFDIEDVVNGETVNGVLTGPTGESSSINLKGISYFKVGEDSVILRDVCHNQDLTKKLMSVRKLTQEGAAVIFEGNECNVIKDGAVIMTGEVDGSRLYAMSHDICEGVNHVDVQTSKSLKEWHEILGHTNLDDVKKLANQGIIAISDHSEFECKICALAKLRRKNFQNQVTSTAQDVGDVIHSDIMGKISPKSIGGKEYAISFIDEKSDYVIGRSIANKSDALEVFKTVCGQIKTQCGKRVKRLVSDNGGEYVGNDFVEFLNRKGIVRSPSTPYTPQRNGKAERFNQTIMNMVRCMLLEMNLPKRFWGEAFIYAIYLRNRMIRKGKEITRFEEFYGKRPDMKIRKFGCVVIYKDNSDKRTKLDDKGIRGLFVGVNEESKSYRIYDLSKRRVVSSRDVVFYQKRKRDFRRK